MTQRYYLWAMVRTTITSKGQTTVPVELRRIWKTSGVLWEVCEDGSARVRPAPDVMTLFGAAGDGRGRDPDEMAKARRAMGCRKRRT
ncbi:MAG: AbrB/MazE/SpoVT family DNA-binding domain-containing protein [Opitutaceae bacterium]|nr:AbrB/MazE/SpoVT family DNA-binding domain-containing protein [Opitutaceae bacterium]